MRGCGRLTKDKAIRQQHYYRYAITASGGDADNMRDRVWATLFHCMSTDEEPHHTRCPPGTDYSDSNLLKRLAKGKTQNSNESLHNVIWSRCSKTVFVSRRKIDTRRCCSSCRLIQSWSFTSDRGDGVVGN